MNYWRLFILLSTLMFTINCSPKNDQNKQTSIHPGLDHSNTISEHSLLNQSIANTVIFDTQPRIIPKNDTACLSKAIPFDDSMVYYLSKDSIFPHWSILIDYNGDSIQDFAGFTLCNDSILKLIAIYSTQTAPVETVLFCDTIAAHTKLSYYLEYIKPGHIQGFLFDNVPDSETVADLKWPGIHIVFYETSSVLFYWKNGRFNELWTSD